LPTELPDVHNIVLILKYRSLVVIHVQVVWCTEDRHDTREACRPRLPVHSVTSVLGFVCSDDGEEVVLLQERACRRV